MLYMFLILCKLAFDHVLVLNVFQKDMTIELFPKLASFEEIINENEFR